MGYRFADIGNWYKKASGAFLASIISLATTIITMKQNEGLGALFFLLGLIPVIVGIIQGIHYMNRSHQDYVYLTSTDIEVNRGPLLSKKM